MAGPHLAPFCTPRSPQAVANQPVVVVVHASADWADYAKSRSTHSDGGDVQVYDGACSSDPTDANHAVLLVGMYADAWVIKNSWGPAWGYGGHMYIRRGVNRCGIANMASYPVLRPAPPVRPGQLHMQAACAATQMVGAYGFNMHAHVTPWCG
jgi:hypothetical protein